jgi:hypothetical protein
VNYSPTIPEFCTEYHTHRALVLETAHRIGGGLRNGRVVAPDRFAAACARTVIEQVKRDDPRSPEHAPTLSEYQAMQVKNYGGCDFGGIDEFRATGRNARHGLVSIGYAYEPGFAGDHAKPWVCYVRTSRVGRGMGPGFLGTDPNMGGRFATRAEMQEYGDALAKTMGMV